MPNPRDTLLRDLASQAQRFDRAPPVVPLDSYFEGNTQEDCIAPNQVGYGRPDLAALYAVFRNIQARGDVQLVLVGMHWDWAEALQHPTDWPFAENVHIYTSATAADVEGWIAGLEADAVIEGWPYGKHPTAPDPLPGYNVYSVCWD